MKKLFFAAATAATFASAAPAQAAVQFNITPSGNSVVIAGYGNLNLAGSSVLGSSTNGLGFINPLQAFAVGGVVPTWDAIGLTSSGGAIGSTGFQSADSFSGDFFGLDFTQFGNGFVFLQSGYISGSALAGRAVFNNESFTSLGLTEGTYTYTLANDLITVNVAGVPEPATWAMMILGFGAAGAMMRRRSERTKVKVTYA